MSKIVTIFLLLGFVGGCQDLLVNNETDPDRNAALSDAGAVQNLIASSWVSVWTISQDQSGSAARIPGFADEGTANHRFLIDYAAEPRGMFANSQVGDARFLVQSPWYEAYAGAANAMDGLAALEENDLQMPTDAAAPTPEAANDRARAFAWLNHGILYGYLAMIYDQASTADLNTSFENPVQLEYRDYREVQQFAINSLERVISIAQGAEPFQTPPGWMGGIAMDNDQLARLAHSYIARLLVYTPRTPEERAGVDWASVIAHVQAGLQEDFTVQMTTGGLNSAYFQYLTQILAQRWSVDFRLIGPGDISGRYAEWLATPKLDREPFDVVTPDRRIHGVDATGAPDPRSPGSYFTWTDEAINVGTDDTYLHSRYKWHRFNEGTFPWQESPNQVITTAEMDLFEAEARLRSGDTDGAAALINRTRVGNGELPPVTGSGVPGDLSSCVPRTQDGTACGTLLDALHYERLIEGVGLDVWGAWFNRRGFGTLQEGTFLQLPVPARELESLELDVYSFGGSGPSSATGAPVVR